MVEHANNRKVWINLRDRFPNPYTLADAMEWIELATGPMRDSCWAIASGIEVIGGIGITRMMDVHRLSAEIGYWLGEEYWNRGICTRAVEVVTTHALFKLGIVRIFAGVYQRNSASMRVLEKNGYVREGVERRNVIKDGRIIDTVLYAKVRE